jgi:hypothetical protein
MVLGPRKDPRLFHLNRLSRAPLRDTVYFASVIRYTIAYTAFCAAKIGPDRTQVNPKN